MEITEPPPDSGTGIHPPADEDAPQPDSITGIHLPTYDNAPPPDSITGTPPPTEGNAPPQESIASIPPLTEDNAQSEPDPKSSSEPTEINDYAAEAIETNDFSNEREPEPPAQPESQPRKRRRRRKRIYTDMITSTGSRLRALRPHAKPSVVSAADEDDDSDALTGYLRKRRGPPDLSKEVDIEALIAISVGFPVDSLTEEEIEANVVPQIGGTEQANYIIVRNHILARWRLNVAIWLTRDQVLESIRVEHKNLVNSAYNFLLHHGYINFGIAPAITEVKSKAANESPQGSVIVIGAGLSGLVAARQLIFLGFKVVVLEGRARPGGRVRTKKMSGTDDIVIGAADLGGSVLTGINGNPLGVLARQLGLPLHKVRDICPLYLPNGGMVNSDVDSKVESSFNNLLDRVCKLRQGIMDEIRSVDVSLGMALEAFRRVYRVAEDPLERMLLDWHLANLEYANATLLSNLSMAFWDQDDPYEMGGDHCFIPGGNGRLVRALAEDLPIFYECPVSRVRYGSDGVMVYAGGQEYQGDMVLCTVPLGVLKRGSIEFAPELPQRKKDAIDRLGFGLLNKVAILFPYDFWGGEIDTFGHLTEESSMRGEFFLFYSYSAVAGGPLLIALVAGEAAVKFEKNSPVDSVNRVLEILKGIFSPKGIAVPNPVQAVCTRWGQDQFSYGSYSYVAVGASGDDYDILAENVADRVFFAGEATNKQYPATMHGAFMSGMREAAHIMRVARRRSIVPPSTKANTINHESNEVNRLFETPDLTFGSFAVLFDPQSTDMESQALLRVAVSGRSEFDLIHLYGLLLRKQAMEMKDLEDDVKRMEKLSQTYRVGLFGLNSFCNAAQSLIRRIKSVKSLYH